MRELSDDPLRCACHTLQLCIQHAMTDDVQNICARVQTCAVKIRSSAKLSAEFLDLQRKAALLATQTTAQPVRQPPTAPFPSNTSAATHPESSELLFSDELDDKERRVFEEKVDKMEDVYVDLAIADDDLEPEPPGVDAATVPATRAIKKHRAHRLVMVIFLCCMVLWPERPFSYLYSRRTF